MIYELNSFLQDCVINRPASDNFESMRSAISVFLDGYGYGQCETTYKVLAGNRLSVDVFLSANETESYLIRYDSDGEYTTFIKHQTDEGAISDAFKLDYAN
jgi:hypothetical protein